MTKANSTKGMVAGFVATVALSALMAMKAMMGFMLELNPIKMIADMLGEPLAVGWTMHFIIGNRAVGHAVRVAEPQPPGQ